MLFHSHEYVFFFLPLVAAVYYLLRHTSYSKPWLLLASLFFYGWWNPSFVPLLLASIAVNYGIGLLLIRRPSRLLLSLGIAINLAAIGYYKYANFFLETYADLSGTHFTPLAVVLPLAISFYTFQQIAFLVDAYKQKVVHKAFIHYAMFVTFFPHLIAGPILNHKVMMEQFARMPRKTIDYDQMAKGLFAFSMGLFKILVIAQPLSLIVDQGYEKIGSLSLLEAWIIAPSFILQLYFDFSAYSDMAVGSALIMGIIIPDNFNSPYQTRNIMQFWQRWNITLGRFFRDYFYMPICGKSAPQWWRGVMLIITFLLIGLWHGAAWTFVLFGLINGAAFILVRLWGKANIRLPFAASWFLTIMLLLFLGVLFRAQDLTQAFTFYTDLLNGNAHPPIFSYHLSRRDFLPGLNFTNALWALPLAIIVCAWPHNSTHLRHAFKPTRPYLVATLGLMLCAVLKMSAAKAFIYFQF